MLASFIITARESLEVSLLIGILLSSLARTNSRAHERSVWLGALAAGFLSVLLAATILLTIGSLEGSTQEALEGLVMLVAAAVLTYVLQWMRHQGRALHNSMESSLATALSTGSSGAVALLSFLAVFREGVETALYLSALAAGTTGASIWLGAAGGFALAIAVGYGAYRGSRVLNPRTFFNVTSIVLTIFGAGLVGQATLALQSVGIFPGTIAVWDTSPFLSDTSTLGSILHTLVGYSATPSLLQVIFWAGYLLLVLSLFRDTGDPKTSTLNGEPFHPIGADYHHPLYSVLRRPIVSTLIPATMGAILLALMSVALLNLNIGPFDNQGSLHLGPFQSTEDGNNLFNFAVWVVWLPLLSVGTMLVGRLWCGSLCPLRLVTESTRRLADRMMGKASPTSPYLRLGWLLPATFIIITFFIKWWPVQSVARNGASLFVIIFVFAAVIGFLFRQGTWCRYICPIGGWLARIARLSPLALRATSSVCTTCASQACLTGTGLAGRCPVFLNPSKLESNRHCLKCWRCVTNCPEEKASLRLGWRFPGAELLRPYAPDLWESLFVASLMGMYVATGHRSPVLASLPWPVLFFGTISLATLAYLGLTAIAASIGNIPFKQAIATFGYIFLPFEFSTAILAFGDDALEFFGITQPVASVLLSLGFLWSVVLAISVVRNQCKGSGRRVAIGIPVGLALVAILFLWLSWYASGTVVDLT